MTTQAILQDWLLKQGIPPSPGLIPIKVHFTREGKPVEAIRWIRPRAGKKLKTTRSKEEAGMRDWQRRIEQEAGRTQAEREQYGALEVPWYEKKRVKIEERAGYTKYSKGPLSVEIIEAPQGWVTVEGGRITEVFPRERDAQEYAKRKFISKSLDLLCDWINKERGGLIQKPILIRPEEGKPFTRRQWVKPEGLPETTTRKVLVYRNGKPYERTMAIDPEHMRAIGKLGFAATSKKLKDMVNDPNADPEDTAGLLLWFSRRIKETTLPYRTQWWREFRGALREGQNKDVASTVASNMIRDLKEAHAGT